MQASDPATDPRKQQLSKPLPPPPLSPRSSTAAPKQETPAPPPQAVPPAALRKRANTEDYLMMAGASKPKREGHPFEQFLVVGIPHNADLSRVPARYEPQILFQWPPDVKMKTMQIEHFCFPNGVETGFVRRTPSCSSLNEVLHAPSHQQNSFIFLLTGENTFLYGVCVTRPEFLADYPSFFPLPHKPLPYTSQYVVAHRCYCLISRFPFFRLHFDVIHQLLAAERILRMETPFFEQPAPPPPPFAVTQHQASSAPIATPSSAATTAATATAATSPSVGSVGSSHTVHRAPSAPLPPIPDKGRKFSEPAPSTTSPPSDPSAASTATTPVPSSHSASPSSQPVDLPNGAATPSSSATSPPAGPVAEAAAAATAAAPPSPSVAPSASSPTTFTSTSTPPPPPTPTPAPAAAADSTTTSSSAQQAPSPDAAPPQAPVPAQAEADKAPAPSQEPPGSPLNVAAAPTVTASPPKTGIQTSPRGHSTGSAEKPAEAAPAAAAAATAAAAQPETPADANIATVSTHPAAAAATPTPPSGDQSATSPSSTPASVLSSVSAATKPSPLPELASVTQSASANPSRLTELANVTQSFTEHPVVSMLKGYHIAPIPKQGESIIMQITDSVRLAGLQNIPPFYCPPGDENATLVGDWCFAGLFRTLSLENFITLFGGLLQEKQIIFVSKNLTSLSHAALSVIPIMRPFVWQGLFIPILPHVLADYLEAPVPFIVGIQRQPVGLRSDMLVVLLDSNKVLTMDNDRIPEAQKLLLNLKSDHRVLHRPNVPYNPYHTTQEQLEAVHSALKTLGGYLQWLLQRVMEHYGRFDLSVANKEDIRMAFVNSCSPANRGFISSFLNTQHFSQYLDKFHKKPEGPIAAVPAHPQRK